MFRRLNYFSEIRSILDGEEMLPHSNLNSATSSESEERTDFERNVEVLIEQMNTLLTSQKKNLKEDRELFSKEESEFEAELSKKIVKSLARKQHLEENQAKAEALRLNGSEIIEICIGGTHTIATTRHTLTKQQDSALAAMFSGRHPIQMHNGKAFIDRDGRAFCQMINYLRTGHTPVFDHPHEETMFMEEVHYWGLQMNSEQPEIDQNLRQFDPEWCASTLILEKNNTVIKKVGTPHGISFGANCLDASCPYVEFKISISSPSSSGSHIFLGVVDKSKYHSSQLVSTLWRDAPASWYWDVWSSKLIKTDENGVHTLMNGYGCDCEDDDIVIGIFYDCKKQTISYYKNGICQGVAFANVQSGLVPSIDVWFETGTVAFLQTKYPQGKKFL